MLSEEFRMKKCLKKKKEKYTARFWGVGGGTETWNIYQGGSASELYLARKRNVPSSTLSVPLNVFRCLSPFLNPDYIKSVSQ